MAKVKKEKKKWYAIKAIDGKEIDVIVTTWEECKKIVLKHAAVYKSFPTEEQAKEYLGSMTKEKQEQVLSQAKYCREQRKKVRKVTVTIPVDLYEKFEQKLKAMGYLSDTVIQDFIKEWVGEME